MVSDASAARRGGLTVTSNDKKLIVLSNIVSDHIWERSDYLLLRRKVDTLLELEVTDSTRQCQIAIDSAEIDEATCSTDSGFLA